MTPADGVTAEDWIEWFGGKRPVDADTIVQVRYPPLSIRGAHRTSTPARASWFEIGTDWWAHKSPNPVNHIIAYRVVQP